MQFFPLLVSRPGKRLANWITASASKFISFISTSARVCGLALAARRIAGGQTTDPRQLLSIAEAIEASNHFAENHRGHKGHSRKSQQLFHQRITLGGLGEPLVHLTNGFLHLSEALQFLVQDPLRFRAQGNVTIQAIHGLVHALAAEHRAFVLREQRPNPQLDVLALATNP